HHGDPVRQEAPPAGSGGHVPEGSRDSRHVMEVRIGDAWTLGTKAVLRPVAADGSAVTPAMRRLEQAIGPAVAAHRRLLDEMPVGAALITDAGELPCEYLVHVVVRSMEE